MDSVYNKNLNLYFTKNWVNQEIKMAIDILKKLGYTDIHEMSGFSFNRRLKRLCGRTSRKGGVYTIQLNTSFVETASLNHIKDTIAHECIHLIPGCWDHKNKFKEVGLKLNKYGYNIERTMFDRAYNELRKEERANKTQYFPHCKSCGKTMKGYVKLTPTIKLIANGNKSNNGRYFTCPLCNSKNLEVIMKTPTGSTSVLEREFIKF